MKMKKIIKKGSALALALALVLSATVLPKVYAAFGIDTEKSCSLTFELDGQYEELDSLVIPIDLYKVADVKENGEYTVLSGSYGSGKQPCGPAHSKCPDAASGRPG